MITAPADAAEAVAEAALIIRTASSIEDPYLRADRVWDAVERVRESFAHARTRACEELAFALEESCGGSEPPPTPEGLLRHARALEDYAGTLGGLGDREPEALPVPDRESGA